MRPKGSEPYVALESERKNWPALVVTKEDDLEKLNKDIKASANSMNVITVNNSGEEIPYQSQRFRGVVYRPLQNV